MIEAFETIAKNFVKDYKGQRNEIDGKYQGVGEVQYITDNVYAGAFKDGKLEGNGTYTWRDGVIYKGEFSDNKIIGTGEFDWKNGCKYEGQLKNGLRHGYGIFEVGKGRQSFEGGWKAGKAHGSGICRYKLGGQYSGEWKEGKKDGQGTMIYPSGNIYNGEWRNNVKCGQGKMRWVLKNEVYEGSWKEGKPNGFGVYTWKLKAIRDHQFPFNNVYKGEWLNGMRHGLGIFYYANGGKYEGEWKDNLKHGKGKYTTHNGRYYEGIFENDQITEPFNCFENGTPFIFHLPASVESKDNVLRDINAIIARHIDELRTLYHNYSVATRKMTGNHDRNVINRRIIWHFYKTSGILQEKSTLAALNRAYAKYFKDDPVFPERYKEPHNPTTEFIFHDLLEHLLLISDYLYGDKALPPCHEKGLAGVFSYFLKTHVLPNIGFKSQSIKMHDSEVFKIFDETENANKIGMFDVFSKLSHKTKNSLVDSDKDTTMTFREFALALKDFRFFEKYPSLSMQKLIPQFSAIVPGIDENGSLCLDYEIIIHDFRKLFTECAILAFSNQVSNIEKIKLKEEASVSIASIVIPPSTNAAANSTQSVPSTASTTESLLINASTSPVIAAAASTTPATPSTPSTPAVPAHQPLATPASTISVPTSHHTRRKSTTPSYRPRSGTHSAKKRLALEVKPEEQSLAAPVVTESSPSKVDTEVALPSFEMSLSDSIKDLKSSANEFYLNLYDQCKQLHPKDHLLAVRRASRVVKVMKDKVVQRRATLLKQRLPEIV